MTLKLPDGFSEGLPGFKSVTNYLSVSNFNPRPLNTGFALWLGEQQCAKISHSKTVSFTETSTSLLT